MATTTSSSPSSRSKSPTPSSASSSISSVSSLSNTDVDVEVDPIVVAPLETTTDNTSINSSINSDHLVDDNFGDNDSKLVQSTTIVESSQQQQPTKFAPIIQIPLKFPKLQSLQNAKLFFRIMDLVFEQHRITDELQMFTIVVTRMSECEVLPLVQDMIYDIPSGEPYQKLKSLVIDHCNIHLMTHLHCNDDDNEDDVDDNSTPGSLLNSVSTGVGVGAGAASTTTDVDSDDDNESLDFDTAENSCVFQDSEEIHISG